MSKQFEFFHGLVLVRIVHNSKNPVSISRYSDSTNSSYIVNNVGLFIKHSTSRMSPWAFSFHKQHLDEILEIKNQLAKVYIALVCNDDGIVCLSFDELNQLVNSRDDKVESIRVARGPREKYEVSGSAGKHKLKIGNSDFPEKILRHF